MKALEVLQLLITKKVIWNLCFPCFDLAECFYWDKKLKVKLLPWKQNFLYGLYPRKVL